MESMKLIKNRIASITSTRQITQSMRLVSTSKVQKARARMNANRPFLAQTERLVQIALGALEGERHPYLEERPVAAAAVVIISADRGLCGGYNVSVARAAFELIDNMKCDVRVVTVGSKVRDYCKRRRDLNIAASYTGISETPLFEEAAEISGMLLEWFERGEVDEVHIVSTEFVNMLVQNPKLTRLLPLKAQPQPGQGAHALFRCEPIGVGLLERSVRFYAASFLYGAILEASSCEQSARITSMDNAVKTADDMVESLSLRYNQARQGAITQEITEIVGGANAILQGGD